MESEPSTAYRIRRTFGGSNAARAVDALYRRFAAAEGGAAGQQFGRWRDLYGDAFGEEVFDDPDWGDELHAPYGVDATDPVKLLFAVHTYYAVIVKAVTYHALADECSAGSIGSRKFFERLEEPSRWRDLGLRNFLADDVFDWYLGAWSDALGESLSFLIGESARSVAASVNSNEASTDHFRPFYETLIPRGVRHEFGEYYTPRWLAELVLREVGFHADSNGRLLDPACGSGAFLVAALELFDDGDDIPDIVGFDLNPLAVLAARANYAMAIGDRLEASNAVEIPVFRQNALPRRGTGDLFEAPKAPQQVASFDFVVGNPPWVHWESLSTSFRRTTKPLWESYGLFSLSGTEARLGGGKKDLSMLFTYACFDEYLKQGGTLGFLLTHSVFKSKGAGEGFRRLRYRRRDKEFHLRVGIVHDFTEFEPFDNAATNTALLCVDKATAPTEYPVPYRMWRRRKSGSLPADASLNEAQNHLQTTDRTARPVDPDDDTSPWLTAPGGAIDGLVRVVGSSAYTAREGVNSGGLNACYWVREIERHDDGTTTVENLHDVGRIAVERVQCRIESDRLFPLLRSGGLDRWNATTPDTIILAQNPETRCGISEERMERDYPSTYTYFRRFEGDGDDPQRGTLRGRSLFRRYYEPSDPFYSMYGVGPYTLSSWKVCWTRIDTRLRAAVVGPADDGRTVLPQETITFVPFDEPTEAHYFCAAFNSSPADALVRSFSSGKGFASAHVLDTIDIPQFSADDDTHHRLAALSRRCHAAAGDNPDTIADLEARIDELTARLWDIPADELTAIQRLAKS